MIGILEVGAAIKFVSNADLVMGWGVFTRNVVLILWAGLALAAAAHLARDVRQAARRHQGIVGVSFSVCVALLLAGWLLSGMNGRSLPQIEAFLPPAVPTTAAASSANHPVTWMLNDYPGALNVARSTGRPVFVDFTGYTCTNCRWMEANIFSRPDVGAELGNFVLSRLYTDGDGEMYEKQQAFQEATFGTVALPLYAVMGTDGKVLATFSGLTRNPAEFIAFLQRARTAHVASR
jgi:thiol:disulfide interchange protein